MAKKDTATETATDISTDIATDISTDIATDIATETVAAEAAAPKAAVEGSYTVASPIKHDGEDYEAGDTIRLPEATAARLAGYLKA